VHQPGRQSPEHQRNEDPDDDQHDLEADAVRGRYDDCDRDEHAGETGNHDSGPAVPALLRRLELELCVRGVAQGVLLASPGRVRVRVAER